VRYQLKTVAPNGRVELLDFQAADPASAVQQIEERGYTVLSVRARALIAPWRGRAGRFPVVLLSQELRVLLAAGLPLVEAIETLAHKERSAEFRSVLERIAAVLREGRPFSVALEEFPQFFAPLYVATVRAAERTSDLAPALGRYVAYAAQLEAVRKRVANASIYPLLLIAVGGLVALFLLFYVVPRFGHIYEDRGASLPFFSRLLLGWGQAVHAHGGITLGLLTCLIAGALYLFHLPAVRARLGAMLWRVPAIGERMKVYQLARFYRTTGMLLRGGMPLVTALDMAAQLLHEVLRKRLVAARRAVSEGRVLSQSLEAAGLTTPVALRMLAVGERSSNMGEMMEQVALFHDEELARWVDWFTRLFEPILMALIGLAIGVIVILMYMPIFELAGGLQ
jgi:general secretion pathway protein F